MPYFSASTLVTTSAHFPLWYYHSHCSFWNWII